VKADIFHKYIIYHDITLDLHFTSERQKSSHKAALITTSAHWVIKKN